MSTYEKIMKEADHAANLALEFYQKGDPSMACYWNKVAKQKAKKASSMLIEKAVRVCTVS